MSTTSINNPTMSMTSINNPTLSTTSFNYPTMSTTSINNPTMSTTSFQSQSPNKRVSKAFPTLPLWRRPSTRAASPLAPVGTSNTTNTSLPSRDKWLREEGKATEWLGLFYDLVVVAVLSVFSTTHEINTPSSIPTFLSYFVILIWIWTSQVHYDARYEAEDVFHRLAKVFQIGLLVFIGAASGGWRPGDILSVDSLLMESPDAPIAVGLNHAKAGESFLVIAIAFAISRALLAVQYLFVLTAGIRRSREVIGPAFHLAALLTTCGLSSAAAGIRPTTHANDAAMITMLYAGIGVEMLCSAVLSTVDHHPALELGERYGALSLIILGEGFINLCKSLSRGVTTLRVTDNTIYIQAFMIIVVMYNIWSFLFAHFRKTDTIGPLKSAMWEAVHLPLHFSILLLLSALLNSIAMQNWITAANTSLMSLQIISSPYIPTTVYHEPTERDITTAQLTLQRLNLAPNVLTFKDNLWRSTFPNSTTDSLILLTQYQGVVIQAVAAAAGLHVPETGRDLFNKLKSANATFIPDSELRLDRLDRLYELLLDAFAHTVKEAFAAILWIYPAAGAVLFLCATRSFIRYHLIGLAHYLIHGLWAVTGVIIGLLGLLDIGSPNVIDTHDVATALAEDLKSAANQRPLNVLVCNNWVIAVVMIVYTVVNIVTVIIARVTK